MKTFQLKRSKCLSFERQWLLQKILQSIIQIYYFIFKIWKSGDNFQEAESRYGGLSFGDY